LRGGETTRVRSPTSPISIANLELEEPFLVFPLDLYLAGQVEVERDRRPVIAGARRAGRGFPFGFAPILVVIAAAGAPPPAHTGRRRHGEHRDRGDKTAPVA
jgi:hypothetical protein